MKRYKRCIMILADGSRADMFQELLQAGELPHIARTIVEPGSFRQGVTTFPSTTGPAYMPFLTGCHPAACNVPGIRWMDKQLYRSGRRKGLRSYVGIETFRINPDMNPEIATLFEILPKSYNLLNSVCRGVPFWNNQTRINRIWYWYYAHLTDRWSYADRRAHQLLNTLVDRKDFQFSFVVFPGIDEYSHLDDPTAHATRQAYQSLDRAVGEVAQRLRRQGRFEETLWWIVSDHGLSSTRQHFCVNTFLDAHGHKTLYYPVVYRLGCTAANMMSGNGMTHVYFRHADGWKLPVDEAYIEAQSPGLCDALMAEPAVDLLAIRRSEDRVGVRTKDGRAELVRRNGAIHYHPEQGDPLGLGAQRRVLTEEESLTETMACRFPDAPHQLTRIFTSPRSGDMILGAVPGYDLRRGYEYPEHRGSHGSLHRDHMIVPVLCNHPLAEGPLRTVDVFATTLDLMGRAAPNPIEGRSRC